MIIRYKEKRTFVDPNQLHNEEVMKSMFEGTGIVELDLYQYPQAALNNQMITFDEADIQNVCADAQGKDYETVTIASRSHNKRRKLQAQANTASPLGIDITSSKYPSTASGITSDNSEDDYSSLLGGESLALDPGGEDISLVGNNLSLTGGDAYPLGGGSLGQ